MTDVFTFIDKTAADARRWRSELLGGIHRALERIQDSIDDGGNAASRVPLWAQLGKAVQGATAFEARLSVVEEMAEDGIEPIQVPTVEPERLQLLEDLYEAASRMDRDFTPYAVDEAVDALHRYSDEHEDTEDFTEESGSEDLPPCPSPAEKAELQAAFDRILTQGVKNNDSLEKLVADLQAKGIRVTLIR